MDCSVDGFGFDAGDGLFLRSAGGVILLYLLNDSRIFFIHIENDHKYSEVHV